MTYQNLGRWLSISTISSCICASLGIGLFLQLGKEQPSDAASTTIKTKPVVIQQSTNQQRVTKSVTI